MLKMKKKKKVPSPPSVYVEILLHRNQTTFQAGDVIKGHVEAHFQSEIRVRAAKLHFHGLAQVSWNEGRMFSKFAMLDHDCKNCDIFLDHTMVLLTKESATKSGSHTPRPSICFPGLTGPEEDLITLSPGKHRYQFEYTLPQNLPSTFQGKWGNIMYCVKFTLERPLNFDVETKRHFNVIGILDLNEEPDIMRPIAGTWDFFPGTFLSMCCDSGAINVDVRLRRKGFILGDTVPFYVEITNGSNRKIKEARVALVQHSMYRAEDKVLRTQVRRTSNIIDQKCKGEILPGESYVWEKDCLEIPRNVVPSCMKASRVLQIKYTLSVLMTPSGWNMDEFILPVYIVIGTVSIRRSTIIKYFSEIGLDFRMSSTSLNNTPRVIRKHLPAARNPKGSRQSLPSFLTVPADVNITPNGKRRQSLQTHSSREHKISESSSCDGQGNVKVSSGSAEALAKRVKKSLTGVKSSNGKKTSEVLSSNGRSLTDVSDSGKKTPDASPGGNKTPDVFMRRKKMSESELSAINLAIEEEDELESNGDIMLETQM